MLNSDESFEWTGPLERNADLCEIVNKGPRIGENPTYSDSFKVKFTEGPKKNGPIQQDFHLCGILLKITVWMLTMMTLSNTVSSLTIRHSKSRLNISFC